jgi:hypothetical protein
MMKASLSASMPAFHNRREMRCVARALLLAAIFAVTSCSHSRDSDPVVAEVASITAPDTVRTGQTFAVIYPAVLGGHLSYVLDHVDTIYGQNSFAVRIWSRDASHGGYVLYIFREDDFAFAARSSSPGGFQIVTHQPDGSTKEKTITILP